MEAKVTSPERITEVVVVAFRMFLGSLSCLILVTLASFLNPLTNGKSSVPWPSSKRRSLKTCSFSTIIFFSIQRDWAFSAYSNLVAWLNSGEGFLILSLKPTQTFSIIN